MKSTIPNKVAKRREKGLLPEAVINEITKDEMEEWREMPEYISGKQIFHEVVIQFETEEDFQDFREKMGAKWTLTRKTRRLFWPLDKLRTYVTFKSKKVWK